MRRPTVPELAGLSGLVALVATLGSLNFSGIPALGWAGMGLVPCDLCWYQRILMYPLVVILGAGWWRRDAGVVLPSLVLAAAGALVAAYHSLLEWNPTWELGQCQIGSCAARPWTLAGLSIANLSFAAFAAIVLLLALGPWMVRAQAASKEDDAGTREARLPAPEDDAGGQAR
ncbi:MAG: disulfide bond formation protein B [Euryarchaeota archaeon]|nr:disulfide bond formation protein B [Euryarchaeota archaeon]